VHHQECKHFCDSQWPHRGICKKKLRLEEAGCEVLIVEVMQPDVPILTPSGEPSSIWAEDDSIDGTEVATHLPKLLLVDLQAESQESSASSCHPSAKKHFMDNDLERDVIAMQPTQHT
jgi:hypothetical protein